MNIEDPNHDDFELWSPSESRDEPCLFGRQVMYHRRIRDRNCFVGQKVEQPRNIVKNCTCTAADFECEFNHYRDNSGKCVLVEGATALSAMSSEEEQCDGYTSTWYERTAYRKIPHSSCQGGDRPDRGKEHSCPGLIGSGHGWIFWGSVAILPFAMAGLAGYWWLSKGSRGGYAMSLGESRTITDVQCHSSWRTSCIRRRRKRNIGDHRLGAVLLDRSRCICLGICDQPGTMAGRPVRPPCAISPSTHRRRR